MRLIDADALFREMEKAQWYNNADRDEIAEELVLNAPTIEPERKKGEWIHKPDIYFDEQTWECSECGEPWIFIEGTPSENNANFCPNCGSYNGGEEE